MSTSPTTKVDLIFCLSDPSNQRAWEEFIEIYTPLLMRTAHQLGLHSHDASDAVQEVLMHLTSAVARWQPTGKAGAFRGWLVRVARNQMLKLLQRSNAFCSQSVYDESQLYLLDQVTAPAEITAWFNREFRQHVFLFAVKKIQNDFKPKTWTAFWNTYIDQKPPAEVAQQLSLSIGAVYIARSRVMNRLQKTVENLVENEWTAMMREDVGSVQAELNRMRIVTSEISDVNSTRTRTGNQGPSHER